MNDFDQTGVQLEHRPRRPGAARFTERIARTFANLDRAPDDPPEWEDTGEIEYPANEPAELPWGIERDRFPVTRHGYDRAAVDDRIAELERELEELRTDKAVSETISAEIERFGEQTAAILKVAHEQAFETRRGAQAEADRCLQDAAANALAITDEAHQRLRGLDAETDQIWQERGRLIEDVRAVATALAALADDAASRFPPESEKPQPTVAMGGVAPPVRALAAPEHEDDGEDEGLPGLA